LRFSKDDELSWYVVKRSSLFFHDEHHPFLGDDDGRWREKLANQESRAVWSDDVDQSGGEEEIFFKMTSNLPIRFFMSKGVLREKNYVAIF